VREGFEKLLSIFLSLRKENPKGVLPLQGEKFPPGALFKNEQSF